MTAPQTTSASYEVGYRKPPRHTQFQKGQSGNPGGRPRRPGRRLEELALYEAYRTTVVMEDGHAMPMPAIQAVLRRQLESAASGNVRAQRDILAMIRDIERVRSVASLFEGADDVVDDIDDADDADAIDANDNNVADTADINDNDVDDTAGADRDDAGGAHDDEPARQQADGIGTYGERRQAEREPAAPPAVSAPQPENAAAPAGRVDAFATVPLRKQATARPSAPPQRSRTERRCPARTAAARAAPPQSGGQRRQNPGGALRKLAALAGPDEWRIRPGPGCRRARPRAGRPCRTRRKIENSLLNSLFSGNLPACTPGRVATGRCIEPRTLERAPARPQRATE
jgi:Family of unknown function (DUF5681)